MTALSGSCARTVRAGAGSRPGTRHSAGFRRCRPRGCGRWRFALPQRNLANAARGPCRSSTREAGCTARSPAGGGGSAARRSGGSGGPHVIAVEGGQPAQPGTGLALPAQLVGELSVISLVP